MEINKTQKNNKSTFSSIFENVAGIPFASPFKPNPVKFSTEFSCYMLDKGNPFYKYFLAKEEEKKENLILIYESILNKRLTIATGVLISYNIVKHFLWKQGYFAYFFYHTRNMSIIIYLMSISLIYKNFDANLTSKDLIRYYEKRKANKVMEEYVKKEIAKKQILLERDDVSLIN